MGRLGYSIEVMEGFYRLSKGIKLVKKVEGVEQFVGVMERGWSWVVMRKAKFGVGGF